MNPINNEKNLIRKTYPYETYETPNIEIIKENLLYEFEDNKLSNTYLKVGILTESDTDGESYNIVIDHKISDTNTISFDQPNMHQKSCLMRWFDKI